MRITHILSKRQSSAEAELFKVLDVGVNLEILGAQSIPRLAHKLGIHERFPAHMFDMWLRVREFEALLEDCREALAALFEEFDLSWWDVFNYSDIGSERIALAQEMQLEKNDKVLDVGCGRGYFSVAAAITSKFVVGVDLMDGGGRRRWWENFKTTMNELKLINQVSGVKCDGRRLPFKSSSFDVAAAVHSIRNFQDERAIEDSLREMKRVVVREGRAVFAESLPLARTKAQEAHLLMFKCKTKFVSGDMDYLTAEKLVNMFQRVGFKEIEAKELNYRWSAAPPLFCIDLYLPSLPEGEKREARREYGKAASMIKKWGEVSTPALLIQATK